jgi:hypothetical protein
LTRQLADAVTVRQSSSVHRMWSEAPSEKSPLCEAEHIAAGDNQVIEDADVHQLEGIAQPSGDELVGRRGFTVHRLPMDADAPYVPQIVLCPMLVKCLRRLAMFFGRAT